MSFIVERYLPGLDRTQLLRSLQQLDQVTVELRREGVPVRYVGSTIVPDDEACFCQFEAPSAAIVAEANTRAGLRFDRIVAADAVVAGVNRRKGGSCAAS
jgi:uncharacterized protein DUF4242